VYVLTNKDDIVLLGPIDWIPGLILHTLESEVGEDLQLNPSDFRRVPYEPVEGYKIRFAEVVQHGENPLFYDTVGPTWTFTEDRGTATYSPKPKDIVFIKSELKSLVSSKRWNRENTEIKLKVGEEDVLVSTSRESRSAYFQKYIMADDVATIPFKIDGKWLDFNKSHLKYIITKIDDHVQESFNWEQSISKEIDECGNFDSLVDVYQRLKNN
jgi:hypothetical protein